MTFVRLGNGKFVRTDQIDSISLTHVGNFVLEREGNCLDSNHPDFDQAITTIVAAPGDWETLSICIEEDDSKSVSAEPILAWGLTVFGQLRPLAPGSMNGEIAECAYRRRGERKIFYQLNSFDSEEDWLNFMQQK